MSVFSAPEPALSYLAGKELASGLSLPTSIGNGWHREYKYTGHTGLADLLLLRECEIELLAEFKVWSKIEAYQRDLAPVSESKAPLVWFCAQEKVLEKEAGSGVPMQTRADTLKDQGRLHGFVEVIGDYTVFPAHHAGYSKTTLAVVRTFWRGR